MNFAGNRCIPAKWRFDRIRPAFPPWREAVTVGVTAAPSVVMMSRDEDHGGRHQPNLGTTAARHGGDDLRHRADRGEAVTIGGTAATSVVVVNGKTITAVMPSMSRAMSL